jgi:hypothetical protein
MVMKSFEERDLFLSMGHAKADFNPFYGLMKVFSYYSRFPLPKSINAPSP